MRVWSSSYERSRSATRLSKSAAMAAPRLAAPPALISGTPASAFETGQFSFAVCAASRKPSSSRPGTVPSTVSATFVIPSPGWNVTVAEVRSSVGGVSARASAPESAIEKHDACAAAMSSSGLVAVGASSERLTQVTGCSPIAPLVVETIVPEPSRRLPCQTTSARRSVAIRRSPPREMFAADVLERSSTSRSARIETSSWSSVGSRVVSRCSHSPGASSVIKTGCPDACRRSGSARTRARRSGRAAVRASGSRTATAAVRRARTRTR